MSCSIAPAKVALVTYDGGGMGFDAFESKAKMVETLVQSNSLGNSYFGSDEHVAWLKHMQEIIEATIVEIKEQNDREEDGPEYGVDEL